MQKTEILQPAISAAPDPSASLPGGGRALQRGISKMPASAVDSCSRRSFLLTPLGLKFRRGDPANPLLARLWSCPSVVRRWFSRFVQASKKAVLLTNYIKINTIPRITMTSFIACLRTLGN